MTELYKHKKQHIAIFTPPFLDLILEGKKTIEARFSKVKCAPFGVAEKNEIVFMKDSGGPVRGSFLISKIETFAHITPKILFSIEKHYKNELCSDVDPLFWQNRSESIYATLLHISKPTKLEQPFSIVKKDRRGWVVIKKPLKQSVKQLTLLELAQKPIKEYDPLKCDCNNGLHTFFRSRLYNATGNPICSCCGADCVNWELLHQRNSAFCVEAINELRKDYWRNSWFLREIDFVALNHALRKGRGLFKTHVENRIRNSVGKAHPFRDGYQTPYKGNIVFYAQHAVAACCRKCINTWHGIPIGKELKDKDIEYLVSLIMAYISIMLPSLTEHGTHIRTYKK